MMIDRDIPASVADQARQELSFAAGAAERANRPKGLLYAAVFLLVVGGVYAITGLTARAASLARVAGARESANRVIALGNEVRVLEASLSSRGLDYNARVGPDLENLAKEHKAEPSAAIVDDRTTAASVANMTQKQYKARFSNQDPAALLNFLNATQQSPETMGVEIARLGIRPGTADPADPAGQVKWNLDVDFTRWERKR